MAYMLLPSLRRLGEHESPLVRLLKRDNRAVLEPAFHHAPLLITVVSFAVVVAAFAAFLLPRTFLPTNEGTFTINALFNPGISLAESNRVG